MDLAHTRVSCKNNIFCIVAACVSSQFGDRLVPTDHDSDAHLSVGILQRVFFRRAFFAVSSTYTNSYIFLCARRKKDKNLMFFEDSYRQWHRPRKHKKISFFVRVLFFCRFAPLLSSCYHNYSTSLFALCRNILARVLKHTDFLVYPRGSLGS